MSEAVTGGVLLEKVFLRILEILEKNIDIGFSF